MNKLFTSLIFGLFCLFAFVRSGCDAFDNFVIGVPMQFTFEANGSNPNDTEVACLEDNETYQSYQDKLNSISFSQAKMMVLDVNPQAIQGDVEVNIYGGTLSSPVLLFSVNIENIRPIDHTTPQTALELNLTEDQIQAMNEYLAGNNQKCFVGTLEVNDIQNGNSTNSIQIRVDAVFNLDTDL